MKQNHTGLISILLTVLFFSAVVFSQTTEFTYQGRLLNASAPAGGNYDFEFALYDAVSGGAQVGSTLTRSSVSVADGIFSVKLDFGSQFPGANRFLEIRVRQTGGGAFTPLTPRQVVTSAPYSVKSLNTDQLGGVAANQYILTNATVINAATQFNIGGNRVFSIGGTNNLFAGINSGAANTTGDSNSFFGADSGITNTTGFNNSFVGRNAGRLNTTGSNNTFIGTFAGERNTTGSSNSLFGALAGFNNTTGDGNVFVGTSAGLLNTTGRFNAFVGNNAGNENSTGVENSFFGYGAGGGNTTGSNNTAMGMFAGWNTTIGGANTFFGQFSGTNNTTGGGNTLIGYHADVGSLNLTNATAIGALSEVTQSNSLVLGSINGVNTSTADTNVGIGTTAPEHKLHVDGNEILSTGSNAGFKFRDRASVSSADDWVWYSNGNIARFFRAGVGDLMTVKTNGNVGLGTANPNTKLQVAGGSVYITNPSSLIITSPNGACWFITVNNAGALSTISVTCP